MVLLENEHIKITNNHQNSKHIQFDDISNYKYYLNLILDTLSNANFIVKGNKISIVLRCSGGKFDEIIDSREFTYAPLGLRYDKYINKIIEMVNEEPQFKNKLYFIDCIKNLDTNKYYNISCFITDNLKNSTNCYSLILTSIKILKRNSIIDSILNETNETNETF